MRTNQAAKARAGNALGQHLRQIRTQHRRTIKEVAQEIGVSAPALWRWEKGEARPRDRNLLAFANAFNLSKTELLAGAERSAAESNAVVPIAASPMEGTPRNARLALGDVIAESKERIAEVAGIEPTQIKIIIEA